jgi:hypothetical protein
LSDGEIKPIDAGLIASQLWMISSSMHRQWLDFTAKKQSDREMKRKM